MKQYQIAILAIVLAVLGFAAYVLMSMPAIPSENAQMPVASTTTTSTPASPATSKPVSSGTPKTPTITAPTTTTSAPAVPQAVVRLSVTSKYPNVNYTPPTAVITLTVPLSLANEKGSYTVAYGDGTTGLFQLLGKSSEAQTWGANDHVYNIPGTYTVTALRSGTVVGSATITVTTVQITSH